MFYFKTITVCITLLICAGLQASAQELWTGVTLRVKPLKRLTTEVEHQLRFDNGITTLGTRFTEFGIGYDITNRFGIKAAYRTTHKTGSERVDNDKERFFIETSYDFGSDETRFLLNYRLRYQVARETASRENIDRDDYIRNRLSLDYNLTKKVQPYAATELFYKLNQNNEVRAFWFTLGLKSRISKSIGLNTFYRIEKELNVKYPQTNYIIGTMLVYRLKLHKKNDSSDDTLRSDQ